VTVGGTANVAGSTDAAVRDFRIAPQNAWAQAWKMAAALAAVGAVAAGVGFTVDHRRFAFSALLGLAAVMTVALGSIFFILVQHLTGAGWSVTVRRTAEFLASGVVVVPLLLVPVAVLGGDHLYPWWGHHGAAHEAPGDGAHDAHDAHRAHHAPAGHAEDESAHGEDGHAASSGHGAHSPEHAVHASILEKKRAFLNAPFFYGRMVLYLAVWIFLALSLFRQSVAQDADGDPRWTVKRERFATWGTFLFGFSLTFAAFDWFMSLEPNWYSTMFGVRVFASSVLIAHATIILITLGLRRARVVGDEINVEHYHDLGKLMFGFLVFWAYISFSEFMLIWYASIPEETIYYHRRWDTPWWRTLSVSIVVLKFIVPFYLVISRNAKRNYGLIGLAAGWIGVMHLVELYYWVMPNYRDLGELSLSFAGLATDVGCVLAALGLYFAVVFRRMLRHPVIPIRDPRIGRALRFVNA
jgi:hypothetical protein